MSDDKEITDFATLFRKTIEKNTESQRELFGKFSSFQMESINNFLSMIQNFTFNNAMFKTVVQSGGRISIPEAERNALGIEDGDLVQVIVIPLSKRKRKLD